MSFSYLTTFEAADLWGISKRRVNELCLCGRIKGAVFVGNNWLIPRGTEKPADARSVKLRSSSRYGTFTKHK